MFYPLLLMFLRNDDQNFWPHFIKSDAINGFKKMMPDINIVICLQYLWPLPAA